MTATLLCNIPHLWCNGVRKIGREMQPQSQIDGQCLPSTVILFITCQIVSLALMYKMAKVCEYVDDLCYTQEKDKYKP